MASVDPLGGQKYWYDGKVFKGVLLGTNDTGTIKFWYDGRVATFLIPTAPPPPPVAATGSTLMMMGI